MNRLSAPFSWYGGKSKVAPAIWERFGNPVTYIEPFGGTLAVLLANPSPAKREIVNDLNGFVANFWRSLKNAPEEVAYWADYPTVHQEFTAVRNWLNSGPLDLDRLTNDIDYYDAKVAGRWVWFISNDIGLGIGLNRINNIPRVGGGVGVCVQRGQTGKFAPLTGERLSDWFGVLASRLEHVYVLCKDWSELYSPTMTGMINTAGGIYAVYLDPPYTNFEDVYTEGEQGIALAVKEKALELGEDRRFRIAVSGYDADWPDDWEILKWTAGGTEEVVAFSPGCVRLQGKLL